MLQMPSIPCFLILWWVILKSWAKGILFNEPSVQLEQATERKCTKTTRHTSTHHSSEQSCSGRQTILNSNPISKGLSIWPGRIGGCVFSRAMMLMMSPKVVISKDVRRCDRLQKRSIAMWLNSLAKAMSQRAMLSKPTTGKLGLTLHWQTVSVKLQVTS